MISSQVWEKLLLQREETVQKVEDIVKQTVFEADKTLKTGVVCAIGTIAGQKFKAIKGSLVINGDINKAIQYDLKEACITPNMSKKERHGLRQQQTYFPDSETTDYCKKLVKELLPFKPLVQLHLYKLKLILALRELQEVLFGTLINILVLAMLNSKLRLISVVTQLVMFQCHYLI
ncbi:Conserved_hypothetical protein [Hexamita inflata]|uniref:Uncharacterized protein n=1 Tax=Hexamita inflata TaxID=28002 RepID=A0ABP1HQX1_9EUKA